MLHCKRDFSFKRSEKLLTKKDFNRVFTRGGRFFSGALRFRYLKTDLGQSRLGMAVSRKVGNAVKRNRIRRLLKEGFRLTKHEFPSSYDIVIVPGMIKELDLEGVKKTYRSLIKAASERL